MSTVDKPKGIRNNNPGNIEWGSPWQGLLPDDQRTDKRFCQFETAIDGIRAIARTLITYQDKRKAADGSKIDSIQEIIERWAPPSDHNPTREYAKGIAYLIDGVGVDDEVIDVHTYEHLKPIVEGIIRHENGKGPLKNDNSWYSKEIIDEALRRAGVVPKKKPVVTTETTAAVGISSVGVAQVADYVPQVIDAVKGADSHLSSGNIVQITIGVVMIGLAIFLAYSRYKKSQAGMS
jgi:hypothetical protein